jgi:DNA-binding MarR family transcriptional regulator
MTPRAKHGVPLSPEPFEAHNGETAIWISLVRIRRRLVRLVERRLKRVGLPPLIWHDALLVLASQPARELSAPDLERELSLRQYQVSRLVEGLAQGELVTRRRLAVAGRTTLIRLTERGFALQQRMAEVYTSVVETEIVGQFPEPDAAILLALLQRFYQAPSPAGSAANKPRHAPEKRELAELAP